jgi:hypothetical protein
MNLSSKTAALQSAPEIAGDQAVHLNACHGKNTKTLLTSRQRQCAHQRARLL